MKSSRPAVLCLALALALAAVGCSMRGEEPSETLTLCGEHSCGDLRMVTSDTSSDGFQYLQPSLSPDEMMVLFTADLEALPEPGHDPDDTGFNLQRNIIAMPMIDQSLSAGDYLNSMRPAESLAAQDAWLVQFPWISMTVGSSVIDIDPNALSKSRPNWIDNSEILFSMETTKGNRLVVTDLPLPAPGANNAMASTTRLLFQEEADFSASGLFYHHMAPAVSPDGEWVAFSRHGCVNNVVEESCTQQRLYVYNLTDPDLGLIPLTSGVETDMSLTGEATLTEFNPITADTYEAVLYWTAVGTGGLAGFEREVEIPVVGVLQFNGPANPGGASQTIGMEIVDLRGSLAGDPDFGDLVVLSGTDRGFEASGQIVLTESDPGLYVVTGGIDMTYRMIWDGQANSALFGYCGHSVATDRFAPGGPCELSDNGGGTIDLPPACPAGFVGALNGPVNRYGASELSSVNWSRDMNKLVFYAGRDFNGSSGYGTEIFTVDFDTTGLERTGSVEMNRNLVQVTYTQGTSGNPIDVVRNLHPVFMPGDQEIVFVSNRRAPTLTLHDRNLWSVPVDGSLEPTIFFFSREDDVAPGITYSPDKVVFSSFLGFPEESLDVLESLALERIAAEDTLNRLTEAEEVELAAEERDELARFAGAMAHLYVFRPY